MDCDRRQRRTAHRGDEVAVRPQGWQAGPHRGNGRAQDVRGPALHPLDRPVDAVLGVTIDEEVHVVRHDCHLEDLRAPFACDLADNLLPVLTHRTAEDRSAVFGAPHHMIGAQIDDIAVCLGLASHPAALYAMPASMAHGCSCTSCSCLLGPPLSPWLQPGACGGPNLWSRHRRPPERSKAYAAPCCCGPAWVMPLFSACPVRPLRDRGGPSGDLTYTKRMTYDKLDSDPYR